MSTESPPRGGVVDPAGAAPDMEFGPRAPVIWEPGPAVPDPSSPFQWLDRSWRPGIGVVCGVALFYTFVAAPMTKRDAADEGKVWALVTLIGALAGVKTMERMGPGMISRANYLTSPTGVAR